MSFVAERASIERLERRLHPVSSFVVVPVFALANAGIRIDESALRAAMGSRVTLGIVAGLVVGKAVGISGAAALAVRSRLGVLPEGITMRHVVGIGALAGIGFTVSLLVAELSFTGARLEEAKMGVVAASILAATLGLAVLARLGRPPAGDRIRDE